MNGKGCRFFVRKLEFSRQPPPPKQILLKKSIYSVFILKPSGETKPASVPTPSLPTPCNTYSIVYFQTVLSTRVFTVPTVNSGSTKIIWFASFIKIVLYATLIRVIDTLAVLLFFLQLIF
jgi:hypothetical protein